jgi:hypothetical protein
MKLIARNYLSGWFWIDVPGSIPIDKIITYTSNSEDMGPTLKALRFIRIFKMVRAVKFLNKLSQLEEKDRSGSLRTILKVFRALFLMLFSAHFLGCMFVLLRDQTMKSPDDTDNWMDQYDADLRDADNTQKYVACLYWALATVSTIGYGDVLPVNHHERTFSVFVALIGVIIFAFAMGNITTLLASTQGARLRFDDKLRAVTEYLAFRDADSNLKRRITTHFGVAWRVSGELYEETILLDAFPRQANLYIYTPPLTNVFCMRRLCFWMLAQDRQIYIYTPPLTNMFCMRRLFSWTLSQDRQIFKSSLDGAFIFMYASSY